MPISLDRPDDSDAVSLSFAVITAVADREGIDPVDLEPPEYDTLYSVVNPEALDSLFAPVQDTRTAGRVEFPFCGYDVVVTSDGDVELSERTHVQK